MSKDPIRPNGIGVTITDTEQIVINFDHGEIPPIVVSIQGAKQVGSHISTAADRAKKND